MMYKDHEIFEKAFMMASAFYMQHWKDVVKVRKFSYYSRPAKCAKIMAMDMLTPYFSKEALLDMFGVANSTFIMSLGWSSHRRKRVEGYNDCIVYFHHELRSLCK